MAVARLAPVHTRRYTPLALRPARPARRLHLPLRALTLTVIVAGCYLQHVMVTTPLEPRPAPLVASSASVAAPAAAAGATQQAPPSALARHALASAPRRHGAGQSRVDQARRQVLALPARAAHTGLVLPPVGVFGDAARVAVAPNPQGLIMHPPSVSASAIRAALQAAGSPALLARYADNKDVAEYIWDAGRVLGVDPAVIMAIFHHESVYGTRGMAALTRSVGNIRPLAGQPQLDGYRLYRSWEEGIDDCFRLLRSYARQGATTIPRAIPVWAPPSDNNDDSAYIASVMETMGALYATSAHG